MNEIDTSIEVDAPRREVYNQWTQFEEFPKFMKGVESVDQLDDTTLEWTANVAGKEKTWKARITDQKPDERLLWKSITGAENTGRLEFDDVDGETTRVRLSLRYDPEGVVETFGDVLQVFEQRVKADMDRFKEFIEERGSATGGWRGQVEAGQATK